MATWKRVLTEADLGVAVNEVIGIDTDYNLDVDEHIDTITLTDGVVQGITTQTMAARDIGGVSTTGTLNDDEFLQWDDGANLVVKALTQGEMQTALNVANGATANAGTVTSVAAGTGMTQSGTSTVNPTINVIGGTGITANADDIAITNTAVTPGSYTFSAITVDQQGRITAASSGTDTGDANQNAYSHVAVSGQTTADADTTTDTLTLVAAGGMTITTSGDAVTLTSATVADTQDLSQSGNTVSLVNGGSVDISTTTLVAANAVHAASSHAPSDANNYSHSTNANMTGHVTSVGNAAVLGSFTVAQLSTALSDVTISGSNSGDQTVAYSSAITLAQAQAAIGYGNQKLVPAAAASTTFLNGVGAFATPAYIVNTDVSVSKDNLETTLALIDTNYTIGSGSGIDGIISGDLTITGDLNVTGTTTQVSTTELLVEDKTIQVASNADSASNATNSGIIVGSSATAGNCSSLTWVAAQGGGNTDGAGTGRGLTGWFVKNTQTSNQASYAVATMSYKTDAGAPGGNEAGIGSLLTNTNDLTLYIRVA